MDQLLEETFDRSLAEQAKAADAARRRQYQQRQNRKKKQELSPNISNLASETTLNEVQNATVQMFD